jgi:Ca2+-binding EF-hand superfamily protein
MKVHMGMAVLAAAISSVALAADPEAFKAADADADGYISATEAGAVQGLPEQFGKIDANEDGQVDEAEFAQFEVMETSN